MNESAIATVLLFLLYGPAVAPFTYCIRSGVQQCHDFASNFRCTAVQFLHLRQCRPARDRDSLDHDDQVIPSPMAPFIAVMTAPCTKFYIPFSISPTPNTRIVHHVIHTCTPCNTYKIPRFLECAPSSTHACVPYFAACMY